jgi:hypothetical protein
MANAYTYTQHNDGTVTLIGPAGFVFGFETLVAAERFASAHGAKLKEA